MRLSTKIQLFGLLSALALAVCTLAGYYGISRMSQTLDTLSGPAWDSADGAMEGTIGVQQQVIAIEMLRRGVEQAKATKLLSEGKELQNEAFGRMKAAGLVSAEAVRQLDNLIQRFDASRDALLAAGSGAADGTLARY